ncbi:MAG: hypothetical protein ACRDD1_11850 [Planctomycetia bacterium]
MKTRCLSLRQTNTVQDFPHRFRDGLPDLPPHDEVAEDESPADQFFLLRRLGLVQSGPDEKLSGGGRLAHVHRRLAGRHRASHVPQNNLVLHGRTPLKKQKSKQKQPERATLQVLSAILYDATQDSILRTAAATKQRRERSSEGSVAAALRPVGFSNETF